MANRKKKMERNNTSPNIVIKGVGVRIRSWRKMMDLKSYQLARILGLSQGSLSDIENCNSFPSANTIALFHTKTDINIAWMLLGDKSKQSADEKHRKLIHREPLLADLIEGINKIYKLKSKFKNGELSGFIKSVLKG